MCNNDIEEKLNDIIVKYDQLSKINYSMPIAHTADLETEFIELRVNGFRSNAYKLKSLADQYKLLTSMLKHE